jgi:hypothetical protein
VERETTTCWAWMQVKKKAYKRISCAAGRAGSAPCLLFGSQSWRRNLAARADCILVGHLAQVDKKEGRQHPPKSLTPTLKRRENSKTANTQGDGMLHRFTLPYKS